MIEKTIPGTNLNVIFFEDSLYDFEIIKSSLLNAGYNLIIDRVDKEQDFITALSKNT